MKDSEREEAMKGQLSWSLVHRAGWTVETFSEKERGKKVQFSEIISSVSNMWNLSLSVFIRSHYVNLNGGVEEDIIPPSICHL